MVVVNVTAGELTDLINSAVTKAMGSPLAQESDVLLTVKEATSYLKCSDVFLWELRRDGKIQSTNAGKKVLIPKSSIDEYLGLKLNKVA